MIFMTGWTSQAVDEMARADWPDWRLTSAARTIIMATPVRHPSERVRRRDHPGGEMAEQHEPYREDDADDLLRRALIDPDASVAVALKVHGLALADSLTVVFHGRVDLGTIQTYVAHGPRAAGSAIAADELLRVPCDLDLGDAESRDEAEEAYVEQARTLRDALVAADTVLAIWQAPLADLAEGEVAVSRSIELGVRLPAHRLMPVALV